MAIVVLKATIAVFEVVVSAKRIISAAQWKKFRSKVLDFLSLNLYSKREKWHKC